MDLRNQYLEQDEHTSQIPDVFGIRGGYTLAYPFGPSLRPILSLPTTTVSAAAARLPRARASLSPRLRPIGNAGRSSLANYHFSTRGCALLPLRPHPAVGAAASIAFVSTHARKKGGGEGK